MVESSGEIGHSRSTADIVAGVDKMLADSGVDLSKAPKGSESPLRGQNVVDLLRARAGRILGRRGQH